MYLLDTNACIKILNNTSAPLVARLSRHSPAEMFLCSIVKAELVYGAYASTRVAENLRLLQRFFEPFSSLPFDDDGADHYGRIRDQLQRAGTPIGPNDLLIASIAVASNCILVTHNTREFGRVVGLQLEDWEIE